MKTIQERINGALIGGAILSATVFMVSCAGHSTPEPSSTNPRDTVIVPEDCTGEDSIAYIENTTLQSPISAEDLLGLAKVHSVEARLFNLKKDKVTKEYPDHRDAAALRLANRFMRMANLVNLNGDANDKLQWAMAVNVALDSFRLEVPSVPTDSAIYEIERVVDKFSSQTQSEMNFQCYVAATVDYYLTIEAYRKWLSAVPASLKSLTQKEYEAWHDLNEARFAYESDVANEQGSYSAKPMEIEGLYENLSRNRRAELELESDVILKGKPYSQKGKTVTSEQWKKWLAELTVPKEEGAEGDISTLKAAFSRWLAARHAISDALPKKQGVYYDYITSDMHCRMIGTLEEIIPLPTWYE